MSGPTPARPVPPRRSPALRRGARLLVLAALPLLAGCLHVFWEMQIRELTAADLAPRDTAHTIHASIKAHMRDGSTVIFPEGAKLWRDSLFGTANRYELLGEKTSLSQAIALADVVAVESFSDRQNTGKSVAISIGATAGAVGVFYLAALAVFGSCPTVYVNTPQGFELQAEGFSYSIAPLMERRDVDPLRARADADGRVRLELRNEALETHFINHIELVAVRHGAGERVVPDQRGAPLTAAPGARIVRATDRAGRDVMATLAAADGKLFETDPATIAAARVGDLDDWIDLDVSGLPPGDSVAVVLRLRNSMLNTILLYEGMLGGPDALDWLDTGLSHIASTVDFGRWYARTMGLRATTLGVPVTGDPAIGHARLGDVGPIAFRDVALVLPRSRSSGGTERIRLRFVADNWRIDEVVVSGAFTRPLAALLPVDSVIVDGPVANTVADTAAVRAIAAPDDQYLETRPGQRMTLVFAQSAPPDAEVTHLIAWQGWYREWVRGDWLAKPTRTTAFVPGDAAVLTALRSWASKKQEFERAFYASKVPVR